MENMELLKAMQEIMDASQAKMLAIMEADQVKTSVRLEAKIEDIKTNQAWTEANHEQLLLGSHAAPPPATPQNQTPLLSRPPKLFSKITQFTVNLKIKIRRPSSQELTNLIILPRVCVTIDGVWIGYWFY
jgi:hypothetical protein